MKLKRFAVSGVFAGAIFFNTVSPAPYGRPAQTYGSLSSTLVIAPVSAPAPAIINERKEVSAEPPAPDVAETKKPSMLERAKAALAERGAIPLPAHQLCTTLIDVARSNSLPLAFFTNLIWQESRFDHDAISPVGAMGVAQFMPDVADSLGLDAFDARRALPASGQLLRTLRARFGNLGLAAAAYNAGPRRVSLWLEGRSALPKETQDYVQLVTGRPAMHWQSTGSEAANVFHVARRVPCHRSSNFVAAEQAERSEQERSLARELAERKIREAARRQAKAKRKIVARSMTRFKLAQAKI